MFLKICKTNYIMMNQFKFDKIFHGFTHFHVKKFMTSNLLNPNPYYESIVDNISIENNNNFGSSNYSNLPQFAKDEKTNVEIITLFNIYKLSYCIKILF